MKTTAIESAKTRARSIQDLIRYGSGLDPDVITGLALIWLGAYILPPPASSQDRQEVINMLFDVTEDAWEEAARDAEGGP